MFSLTIHLFTFIVFTRFLYASPTAFLNIISVAIDITADHKFNSDRMSHGINTTLEY